MKFSDRVGDSSIDTVHLKRFLESWFSPADIIGCSGIPINGRREVLSFAETAEDLHGIDAEQLHNYAFDIDSSRKFNLYMGVNPLIEDHSLTIHSRQTKEDISKILGTFIDFDVKDGVFDSKEEIYSFIDSMELAPTIIVDNGVNGGIHAYWRINDEDVPHMPTHEDEKILIKWWAYITELTGKKIDRLIDTTRISRMPSGIYWPKDEDSPLDTVKVIKADGPRHSLASLLEASSGAFERHEQARVELRKKVRSIPKEWDSQVYSHNNLAESRWKLKDHQSRWAYSMADVRIEEHYSWADILEPHGWTYLKDNSDGSKTFARPGRNERSAVVDYMHDDFRKSGVMSLLSTSEDTRLFDLKEADVPLTKKQVMLRLWFNDNVAEMVDFLLGEVFNLDAKN